MPELPDYLQKDLKTMPLADLYEESFSLQKEILDIRSQIEIRTRIPNGSEREETIWLAKANRALRGRQLRILEVEKHIELRKNKNFQTMFIEIARREMDPGQFHRIKQLANAEISGV